MQIRYFTAAMLAVSASPAFAACPECTTTAGHKASSVIPGDNGALNKFGDGFSNVFQNLALQGNRATSVDLGFTAKIGNTRFNTVTVSENGIVAFQAGPAATRSLSESGNIPFRPVSSLKEFGIPVVAAFYADLQDGQRASRTQPEMGQIYVQYGVADPTPDAQGLYSIKDAVKATRITWYGLPVGQPTDSASRALSASSNSNLAWAQILFTDMGQGDFNFEIRSGDPSQDGPYEQPGLGSIAGFYLNDQLQESGGPYNDKTLSYFAFRNGAFVTGAVPEPMSWFLLIAGFGTVGLLGRSKKRRVTVTYT